VRNAVKVEAKSKEDAVEGAVAKTPRKSHAGTGSARSSNEGVLGAGGGGERLSGEGLEL